MRSEVQGLQRVLILGNNGGFGRRFTDLLGAAGIEVSGIDLSPSTDSAIDSYRSADVTQPDSKTLAAARSVDGLFLCLPESVAFAALERFSPHLASETLVVDTLSVKTPLARRLRSLRQDLQLLSINPLFAPDLEFSGQNAVAVELRSGARAEQFLDLLRASGIRVTRLTAAEHDRRMALIQAATHAAVLSYGLCLQRAGFFDLTEMESISTPPHRALLALLARILDQDPEVYWHVQLDNPYAGAARRELLASLEDFDAMIGSQSSNRFREALMAIRESLAPILEDLSAHCARMFGSSQRAADP